MVLFIENSRLYETRQNQRHNNNRCVLIIFCYFIGRQPDSEGMLSRAVHSVTFSFALDFLTTFYDNDFWFISQQSQFLAGSF